MTTYSLFIPCAKGIDYLLADELTELGLSITKTAMNGVYGQADLTTLYTILLQCRLGNRVLVALHSGNANNASGLYKTAYACDWFKHFSASSTLNIRFKGKSESIRNAMFGAQTIKDAIVDKARAEFDSRPDIDKSDPDITIAAYLKHGEVSLYLDVAGLSLHQRHYRQRTGEAPIKETLAAAILRRAGYHKKNHADYGLVDITCGSATILIEAAMMACNMAPGLLRQTNKLSSWTAHDDDLWQSLRLTARKRHLEAKSLPLAPIVGGDADLSVIHKAKENVIASGLQDIISLRHCALQAFSRPSELTSGLVISNPPYGERLEDINALIPLYQAIGKTLKSQFSGCDAAIITASPMLSKAIGLRADKRYPFYNGPIECQLVLFTLDESNQLKSDTLGHMSENQQALFNKLKKNLKSLKNYLTQQQIHAYRLYDADIPEFNVAIDCYNDYVHVQEYAAPKTIEEKTAQKRLLDVMQVVALALNLPAKQVILKQRKQQKGKAQYQRQAETNQRMVVQEGKVQCLVNLTDYLDTGLFLDHRPLRHHFATLGKKTFLNLFCYTGVASLHAASSGATTTNVDMSYTYLNWAKDNFRQNNFTINQHEFIQADCLKWLTANTTQFDVIFLDPPSFSNSKRMTETLDIQRDHADLIETTMRSLKPGGTLYFSCNVKKFSLDDVVRTRFLVKDITRQTIPLDFKKTKHAHTCFEIQHP